MNQAVLTEVIRYGAAERVRANHLYLRIMLVWAGDHSTPYKSTRIQIPSWAVAQGTDNPGPIIVKASGQTTWTHVVHLGKLAEVGAEAVAAEAWREALEFAYYNLAPADEPGD